MANEADDRGDSHSGVSDDTDDQDVSKAKLDEEVEKTEEEKTEEELDKGSTTVVTKEPQIPKSRFDAAVKKARDLAAAADKRAVDAEAKIRAAQGEIDAEAVEKEIDDLEEQLEKAVADGNAEAKKRIRTEIRSKTQALAEARASVHAAHASAVAIEQVRYDALVERMEQDRPELNPDNEEQYDEEMVAEVNEYKEAFEAKGLSSSEALKKALKAVPKKVTEEAKKTEEKKDDKGADRTEAAVKKGLETKGKQPATNKAGLASDKAGQQEKMKDINKISDKEFDKLDEAELKRMRGDDA